MESPWRRRIEGAARVPFWGTLPEEEWEVHHRDHENRTGCRLDRVASMEEVWTVVQSYGTQSILKIGLNRPLMREVLLTPREMSQTTETRLPATTGGVTIQDPSDTLGDPVVEQTMRKLIETAGRLVANRNAPYGTVDDMGRVQLSQDVMTKRGVSDATLPTRAQKSQTGRYERCRQRKCHG